MEFLSFREIRFADPVTALKLSVSHLFYGTAMGRLVFYSIKDKTESVPLEYLQELIRGISHSKDGEKLYISVGDIEGIIYDSRSLSPECTIQLIEQPESEEHKLACERSYTMLHENLNCILSIKLDDEKINNQEGEAKPVTIADFDTQIVDQKGKFEFNHNSVPFDFDGRKIIWMDYISTKNRKIYIYDILQDERSEVMDLKNSDGLVYHVKLFKNFMIYVRNSKEVVVINLETKDLTSLGKAQNQILALHVYDTAVTSYDKEVLEREGVVPSKVIEDEENKEGYATDNDDYRIVTVDSKGNINLFVHEQGVNTKHIFDIKKSKDFPEDLLKKDFFSMGYPYLITAYYDQVAFTSDYGVLLFKLDNSILS